ncbi:glycine--tRNA ligase subunit beta [Salinisphaera hydrothermalis]|uniref:Glycine--tRNA ligase beta subunit n=1 Tax=Salinisphaera hydrothermalis (strain C41B8) TaxID=1304275 RepID=A0A084IKN0_SALHC|nr:glycine--tRNA ligase subunit beta [Salinisphaera hydrothermalis]KEZ77264.1 glycyl-tRNA synthetase subunit beta [Salinisphaera hydrothermalis C41B8]
MSADLLIEIGVEELPPKAMQPLAQAFADGLAAQFDEAGLAHGAVRCLATPRRLAVYIVDAASASAAERVEKYGPTVDIAYDSDGNPTKAGEGFARSVGTTIDALEIEDSDKGRRLVYRGTAEGRPLAELLQPAVDAALRALPIPKRMRWGDSEAAFVRPVHWVVALHGDAVLPLSVFGEHADRQTLGHRFHHPDTIEIASAGSYVEQLRNPGRVVVDIDERRQLVLDAVVAAAQSLGGQALIDDELVAEVTALVEWPVGIAGRFDTRYLELPREVLIATLEGHQRYFPVEGESGALVAGFVTVANIESRDPAQVVAGNERVIRPRLADAFFFWEQDRRHGLATRIPDLGRVSFQQSLGSLGDKSVRLGRIAGELADAVGADHTDVARAAELAKTDLLTEMVGEFPELQGVMGGYYAQLEGENAAVSEALPEQYAPSGAGAPIATTAVGRCIALGDRLDTLAGIFAIDKRPSGDKDPFGLRRAALGVVRTLIEGEIAIDLRRLLDTALDLQPVAAPEGTAEALWMFHMERLRGYYTEQGVPVAHFEAIASLQISDMLDFDRRVRAVGEFAQLPAAPVVCGAHKRIRNILKRNADAEVADAADPNSMVDAAESALYRSLSDSSTTVEDAARTGDYATALSAIAPLAEPLDTFFNEVMVMSDDPALQRNRLALLAQIDRLCRRVADISCLSVEAA